MDRLTRNVVDCGWSISGVIKKWAKGDIRRFYYLFFITYITFASWAIWIALQLILLLIGANVVHFIGLWSIPALIYIDGKLLPKELRAPIVYHIFNIGLIVLHAFFLTALIPFYWFGIKVF